jgi:hypothetical protein
MATEVTPRSLHVQPHVRGRWTVVDDDRAVVSDHESATEAERAATARAAQTGETVVLHDRYHRVRSRFRPSGSRPAA